MTDEPHKDDRVARDRQLHVPHPDLFSFGLLSAYSGGLRPDHTTSNATKSDPLLSKRSAFQHVGMSFAAALRISFQYPINLRCSVPSFSPFLLILYNKKASL
jgi:hypothetical protein